MALGEKHYKDMLELVKNALNIRSTGVFHDLYRDILTISPNYILQRDLEAMINWSLCSAKIEEILDGTFPFSVATLDSIFEAYYPNLETGARKEKIKKVYSFIKTESEKKYHIPKTWNCKIDLESLKIIQGLAHGIQEPSKEKIKTYSKIGIALKWLQHPSIKNKFSLGLQKHVLWLGDIFGKYEEKEIVKLNEFLKEPYPTSERDFQVLEESDLLDLGLIYCDEQIRECIDKLGKYEESRERFLNNFKKEEKEIMENKELTHEQKKNKIKVLMEWKRKIKEFNQYYLISKSVQTLKKHAEGKKIIELELFKDELLVGGIFLPYIQDAYVSTIADPIEALLIYQSTNEDKDKIRFYEPISLIRAAWNIRDKYIKYKKKLGTDAKS